MKKQYIIIERESSSNSMKYINDGTTGLSDIWQTTVPYQVRDFESLTGPKIFEDRSEAVVYKNRQKALSNHNWKSYPRYNRGNKDVWRVELYTPELFKSNFEAFVEKV